MRFGDFYLNFRECSGDFLRQDSHHGIFRVEVAGVDEIQSQVVGIPELVVLNVGGDEGVAAGMDGFRESVAAGTAAYGHFPDRFTAVRIAQPLAAELLLYGRQKIGEVLLLNFTHPQQSPGLTVNFTAGIHHLDIFQTQGLRRNAMQK